ncbi:alpha/beta fold hydrolase [Amycolatopsis aidingensis]|uniref:alpha/beta fold hydrolase n=1 Tax=Amycolatopsis aidingensis TaxID=2842453 RepID=UPI001C0DBB5E|nr:alpha/beta fold hydrolase [Amycolatopsis aidingensis]
MTPARIAEFRNGALRFPVADAGPLDGEPVLLLHGWPQDHRSWQALTPLLTGAGYRTYAPDLRGASATASPRSRLAYRSSALTGDAVAAIDRIGQPVHVVGHDWGAVLAWTLATARPDLVRSLSALSVPHPGAFLRSMLSSTQLVRSWYMYLFQLPVLPELLLRRRTLSTRFLLASGQDQEAAERDAARLASRAVARGGLNWYRGAPFTAPGVLRSTTPVPVLQVWSDRDVAVLRRGSELARRHASGRFTLRVVPGASHWIPEAAPEALASMLLEHFRPGDSGAA